MILALTGDTLTPDSVSCDILDLIYKGSPENGFYRGNRDLSMAMSGALLNQALIGVMVNSAY